MSNVSQEDIVIKIEGLKKQYQLGVIGGTTLSRELQSWWALKRGKEDPNAVIGKDTRHYGEKFYALNDINLEVKKGETVGIIGSNGAGKSTLLKILSRVTAPTEGIVKMKGRISSMLEVGTGFHPELTGRENIYLNGAILGMNRAEIDKKMDAIIEFSECGQFIDTPVKRYSSGMYVKLAFAVAAHLDAEILVMDEVLAVGDMKFQKKCLGKMGDAATEEGKTVLYVSHNMSTIRQLCSRCIVLNHGQIVYDGDVESAIEVYMDYQASELLTHYDFTDIERPIDHGDAVFLDSLTFLNTDKPVYFTSDKVLLNMKWHANARIEGLRFLFQFIFRDGTVVGTMESDAVVDTEPGCSYSGDFELDVSNLVEGAYSIQIDVISINEFGSHTGYDYPYRKVYIEIERGADQKGVNWIRRAWGSVRLNQMVNVKLEESKECPKNDK